MAYAQIGLARLDNTGLKARFRRIRDILAQRAARRAIYRRTRDELSALSDRNLAELGFHRSEIPSIARKAAGLA
ncbi:DUF1127 domain-containing protein [Roseibacterium sp. SDUM158017]|uniref:DUF1127 domain-containing protein n=1 Tax=Roseicyclus salinarum TaxID=3036773 RepID=UPI00241548ED|nr:DUF1127 domain-containing protein [Roseibacterium sp. SDUM158017]MDG4647352.1 DUF1127 domain-containing protein [Roseibacterium sp. SDUM158017]